MKNRNLNTTEKRTQIRKLNFEGKISKKYYIEAELAKLTKSELVKLQR